MAGAATALSAGAQSEPKMKGRIHQSACRWCYGSWSLDELCQKGKQVGLVAIDLLTENEWDVPKKYGMVCSMCMGIGTIGDGWNDPKNHDRLTKDAERLIPLVAKSGYQNLITFSGNRHGMSDADGLKNCVAGLKRIAKVAEDNNVMVCMELLNSKRSHPDYMCDHTAWGVEVCKQVSSPKIKLLYDIFHMQIMEGDLCDTIRENIEYIAHFHTGGVPGRNDIDETQEINYARVCQTIADTGYKGFVAHEFIPKKDSLAALAAAVKLCDV
jgi:hydroxypyruvate isomerase